MSHPAFEAAGLEPGLQIWTINNFEPVSVDFMQYGKFFTGDSYIILKTSGDDYSSFIYDLHFWLGNHTTQDEMGAAAIWTVTLDDQLGGRAVQHREVQGHESSLFLGYFFPAIRYLEGGHSSGFNQVEINAGAEKRLLRLSGCDNMRIEEVFADASSLTRDHCFILEVEHDIYVLVPEGARATLRRKIISFATSLRDDYHNGRASIEIIDEFSSDSDYALFFDALGCGSRDDLIEDNSMQLYTRASTSAVFLYRVIVGDGFEFMEMYKPFRQMNLTSEDVFILDTPCSGVYIWLGNNVDYDIKRNYYNIVQTYLDTNGYPSWTQVTRVKEGFECGLFRQYFHSWDSMMGSPVRFIASDIESGYFSDNADDPQVVARFIGKCAPARGFMPDDGSGALTIYRVLPYEGPEDITDHDSEGARFYQNEVYAVKYQYTDENGEDANVIYLWIGKDADDDTKLAGVHMISQIEDEVYGNAVMVKIPQGKETRHFLNIFKGNLKILYGHRANDYRYDNFRNTYDSDGVRLFKVEGTRVGKDMRVTQVEETSSSLENDDVFILETAAYIYLWLGRESCKREKSAARNFIIQLIGDHKGIIKIKQGEEPEDFWEILGGAPGFDEFRSRWQINATRRVAAPPTLTAVTVTPFNRIRFEELPPRFNQADLAEDGAYILDNGEELYLWLGQYIPDRIKSARLQIISEYIEDDGLERTVDTAIVVTLTQGREPAVFKNMFPNWDNYWWQSLSSYEDMKQEMKLYNAR